MALLNERPSTKETITPYTLILDLDRTLIYCIECDNENITMEKVAESKIFTDPKLIKLRRRAHLLRLHDACVSRGEGDECCTLVIERPHLKEFLIFCFEFFRKVVVWTAGVRPYGEEIARSISKHTFPFDHVLTQEDCLEVDGVFYKPFDTALEIFPDIGPKENILILDDNPDSFRYDPQGGVLIPEYITTVNIDDIGTEDDALLKFKYWCHENLTNNVDLSQVNKSHVFGI